MSKALTGMQGQDRADNGSEMWQSCNVSSNWQQAKLVEKGCSVALSAFYLWKLSSGDYFL